MNRKFSLILVIFIAIIVLPFVIRVDIASSRSMAPTISQGDVVISIKLGFTIKSNDIVIFNYSEDYLSAMRVGGVGGDVVSVLEGGVYNERGHEKIGQIQEIKTKLGTFQVPANHFFLVSDNSNVGRDSRYIGPVHESRIRGRVIWIIKRRGGGATESGMESE